MSKRKLFRLICGPVPNPVEGRRLAVALLTGTGTAVLAWNSAVMGLASADDSAVIMGPSGVPIPSPNYVRAIEELYLAPNGYQGFNSLPLFTPEGLYPITGIKNLELDPSMGQGLAILNNEIAGLCPDPPSCGGSETVVFGWSQSAIIAGLLMRDLAALPVDERPGVDQLSFMLVGDEINPNGGLLSRFENLSLTSLGITFGDSSPGDIYPGSMYTLEYDGFADFPRYPLNILSDLNAFLGIALVHVKYGALTPEQVASAIPLTNTEGDTLTDYFIIPHPELPLLAPLRLLPVLGNPLADLLQPDLRALVNLGYGDPEFGWSTSAPNVQTLYGLFPSLADFAKLPGLLAAGTQQGVQDFIGDFTGSGPNPMSLSLDTLIPAGPGSNADALAVLFGDSTSTPPADGPTTLTDVVDTFTNVLATGYATLLPAADIANAVLTTLPMYTLSTFVEHLPNPIDAIGYPIAGDVGLLTLAGGVELLVIAQAAESIISDVGALIS